MVEYPRVTVVLALVRAVALLTVVEPERLVSVYQKLQSTAVEMPLTSPASLYCQKS